MGSFEHYRTVRLEEKTNTSIIGEWEHIIVSNIKRLIPESVKAKWHEYKESVKQAERQITGKQDVSKHVETAGWGVEEAQERRKRDASKLHSVCLLSSVLTQSIPTNMHTLTILQALRLN
jgi:hypothetical protein